jgi:hypothetical protein
MKQIIKSPNVLFLCMLLMLFVRPYSASDAKDANQKQRAASAIFHDIMQTLPSDMKAKVDSAGMKGKNDRLVSGSSAKGRASASGQTSMTRRDAAVGNLPDDVRGQVEKAITDIDLMNQNRQIQFKEYEKRHPGSR